MYTSLVKRIDLNCFNHKKMSSGYIHRFQDDECLRQNFASYTKCI